MKKRTMKILSLLMVLVMAVIFASCGSAKDNTASTPESSSSNSDTSAKKEPAKEEKKEKVTLVASRWAGPHADDQKKVCAEYKDAIIRIDDIDYGNLKQKQSLSMQAPKGDYDLVWNQEIWTPEYVSKGWLLPLNDLVKKYNVDLSIYNKGLIDLNTIDGKLYGLPTFTQLYVLAYDREALARSGKGVPKTPEELVELAKWFKEKEGTGIALPAMQGMAAVDAYAQFLYSAGGDYFKDGKINLNSPEAIYAANLWDELCKYSVEGSTTWHHDQVAQALREGRAPIGLAVSGLCNTYTDPKQSKIADRVEFAPVPGKQYVAGLVSYWSWSIPANSKNPDEAFKAAVWLTSPEIEKKQALMNGQLSAITALSEDKEVTSKMPYLRAVNASLDKARTQPTVKEAPKVLEAVMVGLSELATTDKSAKDVFEGINKQFEGVDFSK